MSRLARVRRRLPAPFTIVVLLALAVIPLIYASALIGANEDPTGNLDAIPAAVVNADAATTVTAPDGSTRDLHLGDDLAQELVDSDAAANFSWTSATAADAAAGLADGTYYAVLEIPADFSARVASGLTVDAGAAAEARRAELTVRTDDASNYITGTVAKTIGTRLTDELSDTVRQQYLESVYLGFTDLHDAVAEAADGATRLAAGLGDLRDGASALPAGVERLAAGSASAVDGATALSSGLDELSSGAAGLSGGLDQLLATYPTLDDAQRLALLTRLDGAAHQIADGSAGAASGADTLESGLATLSSGLSSLSASAPGILNGVDAARAGADTLATELASGAGEVPDFNAGQASDLGAVAGAPIVLTAVREHAVAGYGAGLAPYFLALGLWVGAIGTFLMRPALSEKLLQRRRPAVVVAVRSYLPNAALGVVQALLATLVVNAVLPVEAADLAGLAAFAVLVSLVCMAVVQALVALLGPVGRFVALVLTVLQVAAAGGTYPVQTAPAIFQTLHGILPLSHGMQGFRSLISGGSLGLATAVAVLLAWLVGALVVTSLAAVRAGRRAASEGAHAVVLAEDEPAVA